jgi:hypothetical protein
MTTDQSFSVCAFGTTIRVESSSAEGLSILQRSVFPTLPRVGGESGASAPSLSISIVESDGISRLLAGGEEVASTTDAAALVPMLIHLIDEAVVQGLSSRDAGFLAVHAGVVQIAGRVVLLPGATHSGKSSLVATLLRHGAVYFSDEYALIDSNGLVHPYPRPLLLRDADGGQAPVRAEEIGAVIAAVPAPLGWVIALEYEPEGEWCVEEVPQSVALLALLRNTPHAVADVPEMLSAFQSAVAGARCFSGRRTDAADAAARILNLVGGPA